jgi:pyrimidine operon attenuation protein/uracil phosphoribosyltransferase
MWKQMYVFHRLFPKKYFIFTQKNSLMSKTTILREEDIINKVCRIAYQIWEDNVNHKEIIILGIADNGFSLAGMISAKLQEISGMKVVLGKISVEKHAKLPSVEISLREEQYHMASIVIVDDVLHTGKTLLYAVNKVLETPVEKLKTAVMIDRNHKLFPVKADYKGLSLSTSMQDRVEMCVKKGEIQVYLV